MRSLHILLLTFLSIGVLSQNFQFNLEAVGKNGIVMGQDLCNKDTQIDINFSSRSLLNSCSSNPCNVVC